MMMNPSLFPASMILLLPLLSAVSAAEEIRDGCDTHAAVSCLTYSDTFQALSEDLQYTECANASKSVTCLERMVSLCPALAEDDEQLYTMVTTHVAKFKAETADICAACALSTSLTTVMTSVLVGLAVTVLRLPDVIITHSQF